MADRVPLPDTIRPVIPVLARRGEYMPEKGKIMSIDLGGEFVSAEVMRIFSTDVITAKVIGIVVDKAGHGFRKGSEVPLQRSWNGMQEVWVPISERETREKEHLERVERMVAEEKAAKQEAALAPKVPKVPKVDETESGTNQPPPTVAADVSHETRKVLGPRRSKIRRA